jgi:hypothetical protein
VEANFSAQLADPIGKARTASQGCKQSARRLDNYDSCKLLSSSESHPARGSEASAGELMTKLARYDARTDTELQHRSIRFFSEFTAGAAYPLLPCQDSLNLLQMVDIMSRHQTNNMLNRFLTALGMHSVMLPLLGC